MATVRIANSGTTTYPMYMRVTYTENGSGITITKLEGCRTDGTRSYEQAGIVYLNGTQICTYPDFPANSNWKTWWTGTKKLTTYTATFTFKSSQNSIQNCKFVLKVTATKHTIKYNAHTGVASFTGPTSVNHGATFKATAKADTGYHLTKYVRLNSGSSTSTESTECSGETSHTKTFAAATTNVTVGAYAEKNKYAITYTKHTGVASMTGPASVEHGDTFDVTTKADTGYHLTKYVRTNLSTKVSSESTDCSGESSHKHTFAAPVAATEIEAYAAANTAKVTFHKNDGTSATYSETYTYGVSGQRFGMHITATGGDFGNWSVTGHTLLGWAKTADATTKYWDTFASVNNSFVNGYVGGLNLYAVWAPWKHTVNYNANGGTLPDTCVAFTKTYGTDRTISTGKPTKTGYTFQGWATSASSSTVSYLPGGKYVRDQNGGTFTLYAVWKAITTTVTLNGNGATTQTVKSVTGTYNQVLPTLSAIPRRVYNVRIHGNGDSTVTSTLQSAYVFDGYGDSTGSTFWYDKNGVGTTKWLETADTTIYASWAIPSFKLPIASKTGYKFLGWATTQGATTPKYEMTPTGGLADIFVHNDMDLYPVWRNDTVYLKQNGAWKQSIVYIKQDGAWKQGRMATKKSGEWKFPS